MGWVPWPLVVKFWRGLLGRPLVNLYGSSEMGVMMEMIQESDPMLEASILMISVQPKRPTGAYW